MLDKDLNHITHLRFILQQPSPYWKDFGIDEIKLKLSNPVLNLYCILKTILKNYKYGKIIF
jgi:hypothetical protein